MKHLFAGFRAGMGDFGVVISAIINSALLFIVYIIGVGLTSIFAKIVGKHFLAKGKKNSYWSELNLKKRPLKEYYRQF